MHTRYMNMCTYAHQIHTVIQTHVHKQTRVCMYTHKHRPIHVHKHKFTHKNTLVCTETHNHTNKICTHAYTTHTMCTNVSAHMQMHRETNTDTYEHTSIYAHTHLQTHTYTYKHAENV